MKAAALLPRAVLLVAVVVLVVLVTRSDESYVVNLRMTNAGGLKDGSPVTIGGVKIGKVTLDVDTDADAVVARLDIDEQYAPVGRDARAVIAAQNLLGQKQVEIVPGDTQDPAPSGHVIRTGRITEATDLDRVLSVLDADTRARLAIFVNEAGAAFTGRRADFNRFLREITPAIASGTDLVQAITSENERLGRLVETTDRFVAEINDRSDDVVRLVDRAGRAAATVSDKRAELRATLATAPAGLDELQRFLADLERSTTPLQTAARRVSATTDPLTAALDELEPFRKAADPALKTAVKVAPDLVRLARQATPVLERARPTLAAVTSLSRKELPGVGRIVDRGLNNALAVVDNWAGAIQFRDGLSHIFRGEASAAPDAVAAILERLQAGPSGPSPTSRGRATAKKPTPKAGGQASAPASRAPRASAPRPGASARPTPLEESLRGAVDGVGQVIGGLGSGLGATLDGLLGGSGGRNGGSGSGDAGTILDRLLGP
ncbi:MAG: MlaD family protein [Solirubrobacteraceae bacterium]|nr:MlaD family protein [Solirubrobacteraceae bacterium]